MSQISNVQVLLTRPKAHRNLLVGSVLTTAIVITVLLTALLILPSAIALYYNSTDYLGIHIPNIIAGCLVLLGGIISICSVLSKMGDLTKLITP